MFSQVTYSNMKPYIMESAMQTDQTDRPRNLHTKVKSGLKGTCHLVQTKGDVKKHWTKTDFKKL